MEWYRNNHNAPRLVIMMMRPSTANELESVRLQHFDHSAKRLGLHAKTGLTRSFSAMGFSRPCIAIIHADSNQPSAASRIIALHSSSVAPSETHPGRDGTSAQYPVSGGSHLWNMAFISDMEFLPSHPIIPQFHFPADAPAPAFTIANCQRSPGWATPIPDFGGYYNRIISAKIPFCRKSFFTNLQTGGSCGQFSARTGDKPFSPFRRGTGSYRAEGGQCHPSP